MPGNERRKITHEKKGIVSNILGYMPKREDFEIQYDNDAEIILAEMEFMEEDTEEEREQKFKVIEIYNKRLKERIKRKEFVLSRNLKNLAQFWEKQATIHKDEKQLTGLLRPFERFHTPKEHDELIKGVLHEKKIRTKI